jgi:hypothetical protein
MADTGGNTVAEPAEVGSYFVANYPPFSLWTQEAVQSDAQLALAHQPAEVPLGLHLHIPFCRKRCHFCYFRVYTDKNANEVAEVTPFATERDVQVEAQGHLGGLVCERQLGVGLDRLLCPQGEWGVIGDEITAYLGRFGHRVPASVSHLSPLYMSDPTHLME